MPESRLVTAGARRLVKHLLIVCDGETVENSLHATDADLDDALAEALRQELPAEFEEMSRVWDEEDPGMTPAQRREAIREWLAGCDYDLYWNDLYLPEEKPAKAIGQTTAGAIDDDAYTFAVTVSGCTRQQALQVMSERINYDEDYGFECRIGWSELTGSSAGRESTLEQTS